MRYLSGRRAGLAFCLFVGCAVAFSVPLLIFLPLTEVKVRSTEPTTSAADVTGTASIPVTMTTGPKVPVTTWPSTFVTATATMAITETATTGQCPLVDIVGDLDFTFNPPTAQPSPPYVVAADPEEVTVAVSTKDLQERRIERVMLNVEGVYNVTIKVMGIVEDSKPAEINQFANYLTKPLQTNEIAVVLQALQPFGDVTVNQMQVLACP